MTAATEHASGHRTALVLMKSPEADATIDALASAPGPDAVTVNDLGSYWKLTSQGDIRIDMPAVEAELGEPLSLSRWLVIMTSFVGRAETGEDWFLVSGGMGELGDAAP